MAAQFMNVNQDCGFTIACSCGTLIMIAYLFCGPPGNACISLLKGFDMAPDVLLRKLTYLRQVLGDLAPYQNASLDEVILDHYKIERIFELLVVAATDILNHLLGERDLVADTYRDTYKLAADQDLLPADLAERLQNAASMRNLIVHLYERIDYKILRNSIEPALRDFEQFVALFEAQIDINPAP